MIFLILFILSAFSLFVVFSNIRYVKNLGAAEKNLQMLADKKAYNTVDENLLKDSLQYRLNVFLESKVVKYIIQRKGRSKQELLESMVKKVYGKKKTYKQWEYDRTIYCIVFAILALLVFTVTKEIMFMPLVIIFPLSIYTIYGNTLKSEAKEKDWENFIFFPDMLMSLCMLYKVGAVSTIFQGFKKLEKIYDHPLIDEIKKASNEFDYNKDKYDVLNDLAERVDFKEFTSFINLIIESEKNNIPVVNPLTEFAYEISSKRKILATNQILKLPEKIDMVMYLTSTPICFVYMIAPSLKLAMEQLLANGLL